MKKIIAFFLVIFAMYTVPVKADDEVAIVHKLSIENETCNLLIKNNDKVILDKKCSNTSLNVMSDNSAIIDFTDDNSLPIMVHIISNSTDKDTYDIVSVFIGREAFTVEGKCIGNTEKASFKCNMQNIDESGKVEINLESSGGNKYLIK